MARIPTPAQRGQAVGSVQSQFTPTPFQNLNPDADVFGAGQARALASASKGLNSAADALTKQAEDDDTLDLLQSKNALTSFTDDMVNNPENGLLTRRLDKTTGSTSEAMRRIDEHAANAPPARTEAGRIAQATALTTAKSAVFRQIAGHEQKEKYAAIEGAVVTSVANTTQSILKNYNDPSIVKDGLKQLTIDAERLAALRQLPTEETAELVEQTISATQSSRIYRAIANKVPGEAKTIFDAAMKEEQLLPGKDFDALQIAVEKSDVDAAADAAGARAAALYPEDPAAAAAHLRGLGLPPEVLKASITVADAENARLVRANKQRIARNRRDLGRAATNGADLDPEKLASLPARDQQALKDILEIAKSGAPAVSNRDAKSEFYMMTPTERGALSEEDYVIKYRSKLDVGDAEAADLAYSSGKVSLGEAEASELRANLQAQSKAQTDAASYFEKQLSEALDSAGLAGENKREARALFTATIRARFYRDNAAGAQTLEQVRDALNLGLREFSTGDPVNVYEWFNPKDASEPLKRNLGLLPPAQLSNIVQAFVRANNVPVDEKVDVKDFELWVNQNLFAKVMTDTENTRIIVQLEKEGIAVNNAAIDLRWRQFLIKRILDDGGDALISGTPSRKATRPMPGVTDPSRPKVGIGGY